MKKRNLALLMGSIKPTFNIDFSTLADGSLPAYFTGSTWTISSGVALNTPTLGSEIVANGGFETAGAGGADIWADWAETAGSGTLADEAAAPLVGSHSAKITGGAGLDSLISQTYVVLAGKKYQYEFMHKGDGAGYGGSYIYDFTNYAFINSSIPAAPGATSTFPTIFTTPTTPLPCVSIGVPLTSPGNTLICWFDSVSLKESTLNTWYSFVDSKRNDLIVKAAWNIPYFGSGIEAGVILNADSNTNPQNYAKVVHNGASTISLIKCVAGTLSTVYSGSVAYSAGKYVECRKSGTTYQVFYNGSQIGTDQTISDAGIIGNKYHGLVSNYGSNNANSFFAGLG